MTKASELKCATFIFRDWKPCVTHCRQLIRMAQGKPPANEFDRKRRVREARS